MQTINVVRRRNKRSIRRENKTKSPQDENNTTGIHRSLFAIFDDAHMLNLINNLY